MDCEVGDTKEQVIECGQCCEGETPAKAKWKCLDCRFPLCEKCRKQHLQIPILKGKLGHFVSLKRILYHVTFILKLLIFLLKHNMLIIKRGKLLNKSHLGTKLI